CQVTEDRIYTNNGPDANVFGLEPHFGCCTANRHQGWPRFVTHLWMQSADGGLTALSYAPCEIETASLRLTVSGGYPFEDEVSISVSGSGPVPLRLRIPDWAVDATLVVDGEEPVPLKAGSIHELERDWSGEHSLRLNLPADVRAVPRTRGAVAVERGPLVFSLPVDGQRRRIGGEEPHATWEIHPTAAWNYAIDPHGVPQYGRLSREPVGDRPFSDVPLRLHVKGRRVAWELEHGAAAAPPPSPAGSSQPLEDLVLIPYGCTTLRVTEFPRVS
ncbi:MAG TPA: hypothetical protein VGD15_02270, partial [Kribbella sp.]